MPAVSELPAVKNTATLLDVNGNGNAPPNNEGFPDRNVFNASDPVTGSDFFSEAFAARHNHELWGTGSDGTYAWRNQADGFFERGE